MNDTVSTLIGDVPVSEQIANALGYVASKDHMHDEYATRSEVQELKRKIDLLMNLVGDTKVADQIAMALNNNK